MKTELLAFLLTDRLTVASDSSIDQWTYQITPLLTGWFGGCHWLTDWLDFSNKYFVWIKTFINFLKKSFVEISVFGWFTSKLIWNQLLFCFQSDCMIHITDANEPLVELKNLNTRENLKKAACIRNFTIRNLDFMNNDDAIVPDVKYHIECYQTFMMKSKLEKIEKSKQVTVDLVLHSEFSTSRPKRYSNPEKRLLPKECIFCRKNKYKNKVLEKLITVLTIEL